MKFNVFGIVKHKGRKIANGVDGVYETNDANIIELLKQKGFTEITGEMKKPPVKKGKKKNETSN
jgi:hypothetical protein